MYYSIVVSIAKRFVPSWYKVEKGLDPGGIRGKRFRPWWYKVGKCLYPGGIRWEKV